MSQTHDGPSPCPYYTDSRHRYGHHVPENSCICGALKPVQLFDLLEEAPVRVRDPISSHQAAGRSSRRARTQAERALEIIGQADALGASTREIQETLYNPADTAWNKVATRCLALQRKGLVKRLPEPRYHDGQAFLVYEITAAGRDALADLR